MGREKSINQAATRIFPMLARETSGYPHSQDHFSGSDILDQQMLRRVDEDIEAATTGERRRVLPPLPERYTWLEYESIGADGKPRLQSAPRVLTPDGAVIPYEEVDEHAFVTDRSLGGRVARVWERGLEGVRDSTERHQWGLSPEKREWLNKVSDIGPVTRMVGDVAAGVGHIGAGVGDVLNVPVQTLVGIYSQYATELQDMFRLPSWKYGTSRPDDLWEAGSDAYEEWMEKVPVATAPLTGFVGKTSPKSFLTKYDQDYAEALIATKSAKAAKILAEPYGGDGHHGIIRRAVEKRAKKDGKQWLVKFSKSEWNKSDLSAKSRLDFVKAHRQVHKNNVTSRMPNGLRAANPRDYGVKPYGPVGRFWYGIPLRTRAVIAGPPVIGSGIQLRNEVIDEPKVPNERD